MEERTDERFTAPGDEVQRFLAEVARRAGYSTLDILPIEHPFWRLSRLTP